MISVRGVSKGFDGVRVLEDLALEVNPSERIALMGPSGCGKTTLLRLVAGLDLPDAGEVWIGEKLASRPDWALAPHRRGIGMVFQAPTLFPHLTAAQNIAFGCAGLSQVEANTRSKRLMQSLFIDKLAQRYPHELSGGEARRVALARALAPQPRILLLDEAMTNLNRELKGLVMNALLEHLETYGPALIYVTHDLAEAGLLGAAVIQMRRKDEE